MTPRITTDDCMAAHAERIAEDERQRRANRFFCLELDRRESKPLTTYPEDLPF